jgi:diguanylate cyclase (GGDEF)-like protein
MGPSEGERVSRSEAVGTADSFRRLSGALSGVPRPAVVAACAVLLLLIARLDVSVDPLLALSAFYLLPVLLAAARDPAVGALVALASSGTWCAVDYFRSGSQYDDPAVALVNVVMRAAVFLVVVLLVAALRTDADRQGELGRTDPLTGLANTRAFYETAEAARRSLERTGRPLTLAYLDVDDFKEVNDRLGHVAGDDVLRRTAAAVASSVRAVDTVARLGGDEFAVLLPETGADEAAVVLERVRRTVQDALPVDGVGLLGFSVGAATFTSAPADVDAMVAAADSVMYEVKRAGKGGIRWVHA